MMKFSEPRRGRNEAAFRQILNSKQGTRRAIRQFWFMVGKDYLKAAEDSKGGPFSGGTRRNVRSGSTFKRRHRQSGPGESHADISKDTRRSLSWKVNGTTSMNFGYGLVRNDATVQAKHLEEGTRNMKPRPTLANAIQSKQGLGQARWEQALEREANR